ncbi:hypothetical protein [Bacillus massilinigeriensis]|uniref:hypothetical protein n=1 Tax=Bacillus mediterraneensis TaxID=1805474 RepID=UPI0008F8C439|nr:hypothetical protein [Bacillus mediterraneensis]
MKYGIKRMEMGVFPLKNGTIKIRVYGFATPRDEGTVTAEMNDASAAARGFVKKRTIIRAIAKLHYALQKKE